MILPNNGSVVIIDDSPKEVEQLMYALAKERMPYLFFTDTGGNDLPEEGSPLENIRLVFLDLDLGLGGLGNIEMIRVVQGRLVRILKKKNPYVLVIWSNHEDKLSKTLFAEFEEAAFSDYKPVAHCSLDKSVLTKSEINIIETIRDNLKTCLKAFESFNAFLAWESIVNKASGKLTNEITSLFPPDAEWDNKIKFLLYKLAVAYSGKKVNSFSNITQLKNALYTLTMTFSDNIENAINTVIDEKFSGLINSTPQQIDNFNSIINKLLLISDSNDGGLQPGSFFFCLLELENENQKNEDLYVSRKAKIETISEADREEALKSLEKEHKKRKDFIKENNDNRKKEFNLMAVSGFKEDVYQDNALKHEILDAIIQIELNITPLCDYAQEKAPYFRLQPGVLIKSKYRKHLNTKSTFSYISEADFRIGDDDYLFLFDFRYLYSVSKKSIESRIPKYRLKQQLLSDIQVKLGSHINRAGVLFIS